MKSVFYLFLLFITITSCQKWRTLRYNHQKKKECKLGVKQAKEDFNNNKFKSITYGLPFPHQDFEFKSFKNNYAKEKYNIILRGGGCIISSKEFCYNKKMDELIKLKFGDSIFLKIETESEKLYPKSSYFKNEILPFINKDTLFTKIEFGAYDYANQDELKEYKDYLLENLDLTNTKERILIHFNTDKTGEISNVKVLSEDEKVRNQIENLIKIKPRTKPAIYYGHLVNLERIIWLTN